MALLDRQRGTGRTDETGSADEEDPHAGTLLDRAPADAPPEADQPLGTVRGDRRLRGPSVRRPRRPDAHAGDHGTDREGHAPPCGDGNGADASRRTKAAELVDIPMERAILVDGTLYVPADGPSPRPPARSSSPRSARPTARSSSVGTGSASWAGTDPGTTGSCALPFRLEVRVTSGPPDYLGATIQIRATARTRPTLGPRDVKTSLWEGGGVVAGVRCQGRRFVATGLESIPG